MMYNWIQKILSYKEGFSLSMVLHIILLILLGARFHSSVKPTENAKKDSPNVLPSQVVMLNEQEINDIKVKIKKKLAQKEYRKRQLNKKLTELQRAKNRQTSDINKLKKQKKLLEASNKKMQNTKSELAKIQTLKSDAQKSLEALRRQIEDAHQKANEAKAKLDIMAKKTLKAKEEPQPSSLSKPDDGGNSITPSEEDRQISMFRNAIKPHFHPREEHDGRTVYLEIKFSRDGQVERVSIATSSGCSELDSIAIKAAFKAAPLPIFEKIKAKIQETNNTLLVDLSGNIAI